MVLNIETIPDKDAIEIAELPQKPEITIEDAPKYGNLKDESLIAKKRQEWLEEKMKDYEEKYKEAYQAMCLTPLTGRIVCFSYLTKDDYKSKQVQTITCFNDNYDEYRNFLITIVNIIIGWNNKTWVGTQYNNDPLITYNGKKFDLPFILLEVTRVLSSDSKYSIFRRIIESNLSRAYSTTYSNDVSHYDMYEILSSFYNYNLQKGKLSQWARRMGVSPVFGSGDKVLEWYENKEYENIIKHCESNVISTYELYEHIVKI